jgi:hypothetical protein
MEAKARVCGLFAWSSGLHHHVFACVWRTSGERLTVSRALRITSAAGCFGWLSSSRSTPA